MKHIIKKNHHRAWPPWLGFFWGNKILRYRVLFWKGCDYWLDGSDFMDTNKLFGVGYLPRHHMESARFGWRYDNGGNIILSAYCYVNGERIINELCKVRLYQGVTCELHIAKTFYFFNVVQDEKSIARQFVSKTHNKKFSYRLGVYFGGNQPAPQTMEIEFKKA
jgi:hypothetical protein